MRQMSLALVRIRSTKSQPAFDSMSGALRVVEEVLALRLIDGSCACRCRSPGDEFGRTTRSCQPVLGDLAAEQLVELDLVRNDEGASV